jgi:hypothetical protein
MENFDPNFEFYRDFKVNDEPSSLGEVNTTQNSRLSINYSSAVNTSVASNNVQPVSRRTTSTMLIKKPIFVFALVGVMAVSSLLTLGAIKFVDSVQKDIAISEFSNDMKVQEAMRDAYWFRIDDDGNRIWGYNQDTLANYVDGLGKYKGWHDNQDAALFAVYNQLSQGKETNMNEIVKRISGDYESWDDYLNQHGFIDKNGKPSSNVYKKEMSKRIVQGIESNNFDQSHGMRR